MFIYKIQTNKLSFVSFFMVACSCRMFTDSCRRMRIMKSSEAIGLGMSCCFIQSNIFFILVIKHFNLILLFMFSLS